MLQTGTWILRFPYKIILPGKTLGKPPKQVKPFHVDEVWHGLLQQKYSLKATRSTAGSLKSSTCINNELNCRLMQQFLMCSLAPEVHKFSVPIKTAAVCVGSTYAVTQAAHWVTSCTCSAADLPPHLSIRTTRSSPIHHPDAERSPRDCTGRPLLKACRYY